MTGGWGTREAAIPGEWALLILCMMGVALIGVGVFWFTALRHEQVVAVRARRRPAHPLRPEPEPGVEAEPEPQVEAEAESEAEAEAESEPTAEAEPQFAPEPEPAAHADAEQEAAAAPAPTSAATDTPADTTTDAIADGPSDTSADAPSDTVPEAAAEPPADQASACADQSAESSRDTATADPTARRAPAAGRPAPGTIKLTDQIMQRVEDELGRRKSVKWKELAALVQREFAVTVHPRSIERAVKRRRNAGNSAGKAAVETQPEGAGG